MLKLGFRGGNIPEGRQLETCTLSVKLKYYDSHHEGATKEDPWITCCTGNAARVTQRGTIITTYEVKEVDRRLPSQRGTGKCMNRG